MLVSNQRPVTAARRTLHVRHRVDGDMLTGTAPTADDLNNLAREAHECPSCRALSRNSDDDLIVAEVHPSCPHQRAIVFRCRCCGFIWHLRHQDEIWRGIWRPHGPL